MSDKRLRKRVRSQALVHAIDFIFLSFNENCKLSECCQIKVLSTKSQLCLFEIMSIQMQQKYTEKQENLKRFRCSFSFRHNVAVLVIAVFHNEETDKKTQQSQDQRNILKHFRWFYRGTKLQFQVIVCSVRTFQSRK